jgi:hypothetical protein
VEERQRLGQGRHARVVARDMEDPRACLRGLADDQGVDAQRRACDLNPAGLLEKFG